MLFLPLSATIPIPSSGSLSFSLGDLSTTRARIRYFSPHLRRDYKLARAFSTLRILFFHGCFIFWLFNISMNWSFVQVKSVRSACREIRFYCIFPDSWEALHFRSLITRNYRRFGIFIEMKLMSDWFKDLVGASSVCANWLPPCSAAIYQLLFHVCLPVSSRS